MFVFENAYPDFKTLFPFWLSLVEIRKQNVHGRCLPRSTWGAFSTYRSVKWKCPLSLPVCVKIEGCLLMQEARGAAGTYPLTDAFPRMHMNARGSTAWQVRNWTQLNWELAFLSDKKHFCYSVEFWRCWDCCPSRQTDNWFSFCWKLLSTVILWKTTSN